MLFSVDTLAAILFALVATAGALCMLMGCLDLKRFDRRWLGGPLEAYRLILIGIGVLVGGLVTLVLILDTPQGHTVNGAAATTADIALSLGLGLILFGLLLEPIEAAWCYVRPVRTRIPR